MRLSTSVSAKLANAVSLQRLLSGIYESGKHAMTVVSDSPRAIELAVDESINRRSERIDIAFHYVRDVVTRKEVRLRFKLMLKMVADLSLDH